MERMQATYLDTVRIEEDRLNGTPVRFELSRISRQGANTWWRCDIIIPPDVAKEAANDVAAALRQARIVTENSSDSDGNVVESFPLKTRQLHEAIAQVITIFSYSYSLQDARLWYYTAPEGGGDEIEVTYDEDAITLRIRCTTRELSVDHEHPAMVAALKRMMQTRLCENATAANWGEHTVVVAQLTHLAQTTLQASVLKLVRLYPFDSEDD